MPTRRHPISPAAIAEAARFLTSGKRAYKGVGEPGHPSLRQIVARLADLELAPPTLAPATLGRALALAGVVLPAHWRQAPRQPNEVNISDGGKAGTQNEVNISDGEQARTQKAVAAQKELDVNIFWHDPGIRGLVRTARKNQLLRGNACAAVLKMERPPSSRPPRHDHPWRRSISAGGAP